MTGTAHWKRQKHSYQEAEAFISDIHALIAQASGIHPSNIIPCGSYRRGKNQVGDIDIVLLSSGSDPYDQILSALARAGYNCDVVQQGVVQMSAVVDGEWLLELKLFHPESRGAALLFATGSAKFNIAMRIHAKRQGLRLNRYELCDRRTGQRVAAQTEAAIFHALGLEVVPPRDRSSGAALRKGMAVTKDTKDTMTHWPGWEHEADSIVADLAKLRGVGTVAELRALVDLAPCPCSGTPCEYPALCEHVGCCVLK